MKKTLLLGNGINQLFAGDSWQQLVKTMSGDPYFESELPMPLQAILATNNHVDRSITEIAQGMKGFITKEGHRDFLRTILDYGFEDIITTNYSYELEIASTNNQDISNYALNKMRRTTQRGKRVEVKNLIHTYNEVSYNGKTGRIWHIHGEARNPSGMVVGHYYYGNLLTRIKNYVDSCGNKYYWNEENGIETTIKSWIDAFILNEVYILGFGFDFSEMDLWWILERKNREKATHGGIYYYCPEWEMDKSEKIKLMKSCNVDICGEEIKVRYKDYMSFYQEALSEICRK